MFLNVFKKNLVRCDPNTKMLLYNKMSDFIGVTSQYMCGIYHRNYLNRFESIENIIQHLKTTIMCSK